VKKWGPVSNGANSGEKKSMMAHIRNIGKSVDGLNEATFQKGRNRRYGAGRALTPLEREGEIKEHGSMRQNLNLLENGGQESCLPNTCFCSKKNKTEDK